MDFSFSVKKENPPIKMAKVKRKLNLSTAERARRRLQAKRNFGLIAKRKSTPRRVRHLIVPRTKRKTLNRSVAFSRNVARKKSRKRSGSRAFLGNTQMKRIIGGFTYGVVREPINQLAKKVPIVGTMGDEIALAALALLVSNNSSGIVKNIADSAVVVEAHNLGRNMGGGLLGTFGLNGTTTTANNTGVIG